MTYVPVLPLGGMAGWAYLSRTRDRQEQAFAASPATARDSAYFREKIGGVETAADLISDRRLLRVALGAFGLSEDIGNKAFLRRVLEDGTTDPKSLANRLSDKRYLAFSKAFGFGDLAIPNTKQSGFADKINDKFVVMQFEAAIGEQSPELRLVAGLDREITDLLAKQTSENGLWYSVMGSPSLRRVFETALGLPSGFGALDLDRQLVELRSKSERQIGIGSLRDLAQPEKRENLTRLFLVRSQASGENFSSPASTAVTLLQSMTRRV